MAYKLVGQQASALLGGVLGGLISSTATTVSYARRAKSAPDAAPLAALVIMIASSIAFARVIVELAVVAPGILSQVAPPLGAMFVLMALLSAGTFVLSRGARDEMPEQENPAELKSALIFGAIYAVVIFAVAAAEEYFGTGGLYVVALLSGLTDLDAITLSTARLAAANRIDIPISWRLILLASLANLVFKGGTVAVLGPPQLTKRIAALFGIAVVGGLLIFWLWPNDLVLPWPPR